MGIFDKIKNLFGNNNSEVSSDNVDNDKTKSPEEKNPWKVPTDVMERIRVEYEQNRKQEIEKENQLKFVFRNLVCRNENLTEENIYKRLLIQGHTDVLLDDLDVGIMQRFNSLFRANNLPQEDLDYLFEDPDRIVGLNNMIREDAIKEAREFGKNEKEASNFIDVIGKIDKYKDLEIELKALPELE